MVPLYTHTPNTQRERATQNSISEAKNEKKEVDKMRQTTGLHVCQRQRVHVRLIATSRCTRGHRAKTSKWKMKGFPGSEQNSDDTSPAKHDLSDFETSLRIHIRHESGKEREKCTSNRNLHFFHFFQFFKTLGRIFSASVDSHNSFMRKKVSNRKGNHKERRCQIKQKRKNVFFLHLTPHEGLFQKFENKNKDKKTTPLRPGLRPHMY